MTTADRMAVLEHGVVQQVGTPMALYDEPVNAFVAGFVGTMNLLPATAGSGLDGGAALTIEGIGTLRLAPGACAIAQGPATLGLRPHGLRIQAAGLPRDAGLLWADAVVEASEFLGGATRYRLRAGAHVLSADAPHGIGQGQRALGEAVAVGLDPAQARVLAV